jgi:hypothetical protein
VHCLMNKLTSVFVTRTRLMPLRVWSSYRSTIEKGDRTRRSQPSQRPFNAATQPCLARIPDVSDIDTGCIQSRREYCHRDRYRTRPVHMSDTLGHPVTSATNSFSTPTCPMQMCQHHQVYTTMCICVTIFTIIFQRISHSTCHVTRS